MQHTIALTEQSEQALRKLAEAGGQSVDEILATMAEALLVGDAPGIVFGYEGGLLSVRVDGNALLPIRSTPGVMGGDACIGNTRIPVWLLVRAKQSGFSDERILANYPGLSASDLLAAWDYYASHTDEVESQRRSHEDAA